MQGLSHQISLISNRRQSLDSFRVPDSLHLPLKRLKPGGWREVRGSTISVSLSAAEDALTVDLTSYLNLPILTLLQDQGPVGTAMASYLKWDDRQVLMMHCHWDKFHRIINDMKLASEHASGNAQFLGHFQVCDDYLFVEAFAGSANLSYIVKQIGLQVVPIDHPGNKHHPKCKLLLLDLTQETAWNYMHYLKNNVLVLAWHFAPPCGTASKARNIPMENGPPPLRDENNVEGFDWLKGKVLERVLAANLLYKNTSDFCVDLDSANHIFSVENPTGSWMWEMPCFSKLIDIGLFVDCESCAFGGARRKARLFW